MLTHKKCKLYIIILELNIMEGQEWIWAVEGVNCVGLILRKPLRFSRPHLCPGPSVTHSPSVPTSSLRAQVVPLPQANHAPLGMYFLKHNKAWDLSFQAAVEGAGQHSQEVQGSWSPIGDEKPNTSPSSLPQTVFHGSFHSPLVDIPNVRACTVVSFNNISPFIASQP